MCIRRWLVVLGLVLLTACGGRSSRGGAARDTYGGVAFVPADATYAVVARSVDDLQRVAHDLADAFGPIGGIDAAMVSAGMTEELGIDLLAASGLSDLGVDVAAGAAVWARGGVAPVMALPLADPARFDAWIDAHRGGLVIQVATVDGHEVSTLRPDRDFSIHWAVVDRWLLVHLALTEEREVPDAWLRSALTARGGFATEPDFVAALDEAKRRLDGPSPAVVGLVRVPAILATVFGMQFMACDRMLAPVQRVFLAAASEPRRAQGSVVVEIGAASDTLAAAMIAPPVGWSQARGAPPLAVEWNLDLRRLQPMVAGCLDDEVGALVDIGVYGGAAFAYQLDVDGRRLNGAAAARVRDGLFDDLVDEIPGISFLSRDRTVGANRVVDVDVPLVPAFSYSQRDDQLTVAAGVKIDGLLERAAATPGGDLARIEVRPQAWPAATWDRLLASVMSRDQARRFLVGALRRWTLGAITAHLEGRAIVITAVGER